MSATEILGLRAYGRHRKEAGLPGQTHAAVRKAIDRGTLTASVSHNAKGHVQIDRAKADKEWARGTDPTQQRDPEVAKGRFSGGEDKAGQGALFPEARVEADPTDTNEGPSLRTAQAVRVAYQARLTQLDFEERSAQLCRVEVVKAEAFRLARLTRDKILNVADRVCAQLAAETDATECRNLVLRELNVAMQDLTEQGHKEYGENGNS